MSSTLSRRRLMFAGLVAPALVHCRREPDVDSSHLVTNGKDKPMPDPETVTLVGILTELGRPPGIMPGFIAPQQSVSLRVESAEGMNVPAGTTVEIVIKLMAHVPMVTGAHSPAPELDPAYFRVGRRFRIATMPANDRYYARIDKDAIQPLD